MSYLLDKKGNHVYLTKQIASSGEGEVWETDHPKGYLAKIYHSPTPERIKKLEVMLSNPPEDPTLKQNHISIAWPKDILKDSRGNYTGFLMPCIANPKELLYVYNPRQRNTLQQIPFFNWYCLHITALNIASIVQAIHAKDYVIGDMKTQNMLVNPQGLVSVIDTDSFQVTEPKTGVVYRCSVGSEGFTPPELIGKDFTILTQMRIHDNFRLAVIIHLLLFGYHPFTGKWEGSGDQPGQDDSISRNLWPYSQNSELKPSINTIPLEIVHPEIKQLFLKCFNDGHKFPDLRPSAADWFHALKTAISDLRVCGNVNNHIYSETSGNCYWCERANKLGADIFPAVSQPIHPPPKTHIHPQPKPHTYLQLHNNTTNKVISAAYAYWDGKGWHSVGWFIIQPKQVISLDIGENYKEKIYIYAQHDGGKITWGSGKSSFWVDPINAFNITNSDQDTVGNAQLKKVPMFEYLVSPGTNDWYFNFQDSPPIVQPIIPTYHTPVSKRFIAKLVLNKVIPKLVWGTVIATEIIIIIIGWQDDWLGLRGKVCDWLRSDRSLKELICPKVIYFNRDR